MCMQCVLFLLPQIGLGMRPLFSHTLDVLIQRNAALLWYDFENDLAVKWCTWQLTVDQRQVILNLIGYFSGGS